MIKCLTISKKPHDRSGIQGSLQNVQHSKLKVLSSIFLSDVSVPVLLISLLAPIIFLTPLPGSPLVGTLPGDVVVTNKGNAVYSMPISLPEGIAGMTPELSIEYDSTSGNGLLGMGFSLGGLSAISRTATTLEQDGFTDGIDFDANDRFALDGQRLVCVSGEYGAPDSEYRTEIESFVRVIAHGTATSGPDYFTIKTKSGLTKTYGKSNSTSLVYDLDGNLSDGAKVSWLLEKIEDSTGNVITYNYAQSTNSQQKYVSEIVYGAAVHPLKVIFERETREDEIFSFLRGVNFSSDERLKAIRVFSGSTEIYAYALNYNQNPVNAFSVLTSVTYLDSGSGKSMSSSFDWLNVSDSVEFTTWSGPATYVDSGAASLDISRVKFGDFNGDGLLDMYYINGAGIGSNHKDHVYLSDGNGNFTKYDNGPNTYVDNHATQIDISRIQLSDFNGDGMTDVYRINGADNSANDSLYISNGDGTFTPWSGPATYMSSGAASLDISRVRFGDFNGDGMLDVYYVTGAGSSVGDHVYLSDGNGNFTEYNTGPETYVRSDLQEAQIDVSRVQLADFNGDGMTDVYRINGATSSENDSVYISNGDGTFTPWSGPATYINSGAASLDISRVRFGDFNGDGLLDVYYVVGAGIGSNHKDHVYLSDGNGNFTKYDNGPNTYVDNYAAQIDVSRIHLADFNGDGMTDVYRINGADNSANDSLYISNGDGTFTPWSGPATYIDSGSASLDISRVRFGDFNGDGLLDVYYVVGAGIGSNHKDHVYLSDGNGNFTKYDNGPNTYVDNYAAQIDVSRIQVSDFNGDGMTDVYRINGATSSDNDSLYIFQSEPTLLAKITDNFGVSSEITYKPLTDKSVYEKGVNDATPKTVTIQTPMRVVASITKDVGIDDENDNPILYTTEYTYAEARYHTHGRGFLGFRVFESYDVQTQITKTDILHHDFPYTGMTISSSTYGPNGQMLTRSVNTVNAKVLNGGLTLFPYNQSSEEWKAEYDSSTDFSSMSEDALVDNLKNQAYANALTTNDFDANGNNIEIFIDYGDGYTQTTANKYAYDNLAVWYLGRLSSATVTSTAPDTTTQDETIVRKSSFTYDSNGLLLTETIEPGHHLAVATTYTRDLQGRIVSTQIDPADGPAFISETHSVLDSTGRFYTQTTNALGHTETRVYDSTRGWLRSQTGPNGRTTHFTYDALGRVVREDYPDGTWTAIEYVYDSSQTVTNPDNELSATSKYRITNTASVSPPTTTWHDRTGQAIRSRTESFDGQAIYQDTGYNKFGQVDCIAENYYAATGPTHWTKTTFDGLGRVDVVTAPDGTKAKMIYNGRQTTTIRNYEGTDVDNANANDQVSVSLLNAKGDDETVTSYDQEGNALVLSYRYDGVGNLLETEDSEGRVISMTYDILGNKIGMDDPDMGVWSYTYNALGQLVSQTDAVGNISTKTYDKLGRVIEESYDAADFAIATVTHNYYYDGSGDYQQLGKLHLEKSSTGFRRSHYYDNLGRAFLTLSRIEGRWFYQQTDYDNYSRPERLTHYWRPPDFDDGLHDHYLAWYSYSQETVYDDRSFITEVRDGNGQIWWSSPTYNQHGQLTSYLAGNGLRTNNEFDTANQTLKRIYVTPTAGSESLLDHSYEFDAIGNLTQRTDNLQGLTENMSYDRLNRLTAATVVDGATVNIEYDDLGNIINRTSTSDLGNVGAYDYVTGTNRVSNAGGRAFTYNANGAITKTTGSKTGSITWAAFNKPYVLESSGKRSVFSYDNNISRLTQTRQELDPDFNAGQGGWLDRTRKTYVGALFEQEQAWNPISGSEKWDITSTRIYISTPSGVVGSWIDNASETTPQKTFFHRDHLGSVIAESGGNITDTETYAQITKQFSYDAWGLARDANDWDATPATAPERAATDRGYTGHEMLDELGLIHMNGRIYDPLLGRFLSADPFIQAPANLQNYNRYSYVLNNPLSINDPSGFFFKKLFKSIKKFVKENWRTIVAIALYFVPVIGPALSATWIIAVGYHYGGVKGALVAYASLVITAGIGIALPTNASLFAGGIETLTELARAMAHGVAQGGLAEISGGDFGASFLAGFSGSITGSMMKSPKVQRTLSRAGPVVRTTTAAIVGGTVAEIGGGKFANGAATAAMVSLFSEVGRSNSRGSSQTTGNAAVDAQLAEDVYRNNPQGAGDYSMVGSPYVDAASGGRAVLYANTTGDSVLVYAGTTLGSASNWIANFKQAFGFKSAQYEWGIDLAVNLSGSNPGLRFAGHSLGGGIASAAAIVTGGSANIFNAAGVHNNTLRGFSRSHGSVNYHYSNFDVLRYANYLTPSRVPGNHISVGNAGFHGIGGVVDALNP